MNDIQNIDSAAEVLAREVRAYLGDRPSGKGRRETGAWSGVVGRALGRRRVSRDLFDAVVGRALDRGLLVKRTNASGRERLYPGPQLPLDLEISEEARNPPAQTEGPPVPAAIPKKGGRAPRAPFPSDFRCPQCKMRAAVCGHCQSPAFEDDLYANSKGEWRCDGCNDIHFTESWGGFARWKEANAPGPEGK
jgi:hypothetical protein